MVGMPDDRENRTVTGVDGRAAWGARVRSAAPGAGTNIPAYIVPLACTGRNPGWTPPDRLSRTSRRSLMSVDDMSHSSRNSVQYPARNGGVSPAILHPKPD